MIGSTDSNDGDVNSNHGGFDGWLIKLDPNGNKEWSKAYGGSAADYFSSIVASKDGGYVIAGSTSSNNGDILGNHGKDDAWILKVDGSGKMLWSKVYGGTLGDAAISVSSSKNGGYIIAGNTFSNDGDLTGSHGNEDAFVMKVDDNGTKQWSKLYGGSDQEYVSSVIESTPGGYVVTGGSMSNNGDLKGFHSGPLIPLFDAWVLKLKDDGTVQWSKLIGGTDWDDSRAVVSTSDGGYLVAGKTYSNDGDVTGNRGGADGWLVKLSGNGTIAWSKLYGGSDDEQLASIKAIANGRFILAGYSISKNGDIGQINGISDGWILMVDGTGNKLYSKPYGGTGSEDFNSIISSVDGSYVAAGRTTSNNGDYSTNHGRFDALIMKVKIP